MVMCGAGRSWCAAQSTFTISSYGAVGDGKTICTLALQRAVDACHRSGGGEVLIPPGVFLIGTVHLRSNITLYVQSGAVLKGSPTLQDYETFEPGKPFKAVHKGMFFTEDADNITISGEGQIDGNGDEFFEKDQAKKLSTDDTKFTRQKENFRKVDSAIGDGPMVPRDRPYQMFVFSHCTRVTIKDLLITTSPFWCMHFADCDAVRVSGIRLWNNLLAPNADGIDVTSCSNVIIEGCDIRTGDDAIAIVGYNHHFEIPGFRHLWHPSGNIIISNCNLQSYSSAIRIGFLDQNSVKNVHVSNVNITNSTRGIGIFVRDQGSLENLTFSNISIETFLRTGDWWGNGEPIHISAVRGKEGVPLGQIKHVLFENIICQGESGILLYGSSESQLEDICFDHVRFEIRDSKINDVAGGNIDLRGSNLQPSLFASDIPALLARYIKGLRISDFALQWTRTRMPWFTNGLTLQHFENVVVNDFDGSGSPINPSAFRIYAEDGINFRTNDSSHISLKNVQK